MIPTTNPSEAMARHRSEFPDFPWLAADDPAGIEAYLRGRGWVAAEEGFVSAVRPGEGNMNLTLRIRTDRRSFILKQARPWVEKYDHIAAPWDRILMEERFYRAVAPFPKVAGLMPGLIGSDPAGRTLALEDFPDAADLSLIYHGGRLERGEVEALGSWLRALHDTPVSAGAGAGAGAEAGGEIEFANREMRALNHEHIYVYPLRLGNDLDLDRHELGLAEAAERLKRDHAFGWVVGRVGAAYLADGPALLHGDFFPGSWLRAPAGPRVIDPEFCFCGPREFDVACAVAHMALARQTPDLPQAFMAAYAGRETPRLNMELVARFAAVEIMRRLIGVAQLPIPPTDGWRAGLLERARRAAMEASMEPVWDYFVDSPA